MIRRDERTGAPTLLFRVHVDRGISWDMAQGFLQQALAPAAAPAADAAGGAETGIQGQALASPLKLSGDQGKSKQKLKIRLGGRLFTTDSGRCSGRTDETISQHPSPTQLPPPADVPDGVRSSSAPSPGSAILDGDPASALQQQQLQDMEHQSRMETLDMAAQPASASHTDTDCTMNSHPPNHKQVPGVGDTPDGGVRPSADLPFSQSQQSPAFNHLGAFDESGHEGLHPQSLHSNLGSGSVLGAVVADVPKAEPSSSPAGEDACGPSSTSGYYRPERGAVRGVLLALETQGKGQVAVYRPATGPAARPMRLAELQNK